MSERTAVYRLYDADDELLYVGMTNNIDRRFGTHAEGKFWWPEVARREVAWLDSRTDAMVAERTAIRNENPRHNKADRPYTPKPPSGTKTSIWLPDDLAKRWKASEASLAELVRRGLDAGDPEPEDDKIARLLDERLAPILERLDALTEGLVTNA